MSLIKDVRADLGRLDYSKKGLRKFGLVVGGILVLIAVVLSYLRGSITPVLWIVAGIGILLTTLALVIPSVLKETYRYWMGFAVTLGWFVSRLILLLLFFGLFTPLGLIARLVRKRFLDVRFRDGVNSYWVPKQKAQESDYEKMY